MIKLRCIRKPYNVMADSFFDFDKLCSNLMTGFACRVCYEAEGLLGVGWMASADILFGNWGEDSNCRSESYD